VRFVDAEDFEGLKAAINEKTKAVYTETIGIRKLDISDIEKLATISHEHGLPLVVDNTTPSPALARPIEGGGHVVNSATKFIGGHGTSIGGIIVEPESSIGRPGRLAILSILIRSYHGVSYTEAFGPLAFIV